MKKFFLGILVLFIFSISSFALSNSFKIDKDKVFTTDNINNEIASNFNSSYKVEYEDSKIDSKLNKEIITLTKKTTYLLLGKENNVNESAEDYEKRYKEYLKLRYNPTIPKDPNSLIGLDESSQEYKDDIISGISLPGIFNTLSKMEAVYSKLGEIRVIESNGLVISKIILPHVRIEYADKEEPMKIRTKYVDMTLYYYYKNLNGKYKLYYLMGEYDDSIEEYFNQVESSENKGIQAISQKYDSSLKDIYSYEKLNNISKKQLEDIYRKNIDQIVILNTYYNNGISNTATGYFINNGIVATTWKYLEKSLLEGEKIIIRDYKENIYNLEGIVTIDKEADLAILKVNDSKHKGVTFGNYKTLKKEDPIFSIGSKSGVGLALQVGIVTTSNGNIQSLLPLSEKDEGSPLINSKGEVVGINTSESINTSISTAKNNSALIKLQKKFNKINYKNIESISFDKLKEEYYYNRNNNEIIKTNIKDKVWKEYSKIGNIEKTIKLKLLKSSYKDGILSLRYSNSLSKYMSGMEVSAYFRSELIKDNYKNTLSSENKSIYENGKYKVIIMEEFNYLIIVMVKL